MQKIHISQLPLLGSTNSGIYTGYVKIYRIIGLPELEAPIIGSIDASYPGMSRVNCFSPYEVQSYKVQFMISTEDFFPVGLDEVPLRELIYL